jgi:hypothetical protein
MRAVVTPELRVSTERKTGLYVPNVETARLVRDERGWLRATALRRTRKKSGKADTA